MTAKEMPLKCYREACTNGADVRGYNRITHGLYCIPCARRAPASDNLYPLLGGADVDVEGGAWARGLVVVRPAQVTR